MKKLKNKNIILTSALAFLFPFIASAQFSLESSTFAGIVAQILNIINAFWPAMVGLAFLMFFWGMAKFLLNAGNKGELEKGRSYMLWGAVVLFVLFGVRSIIGIVASDFGIGPSVINVNCILLPTGVQSGC